ncbi:MAG: ABC transporter permease subunit [Candidatus Omnitrophica bacterium]|nr:ABC transporter permease subunit [Candidatus Omnitrophota bacterium]
MSWVLLQNSLLVSGLATVLAASLGFLAALWLAGLEGARRKWLLGSAAVALALPPFLVTGCWLHWFGYTGILRGWLPLDIYSRGGAVWILGMLYWPIAMFLVLGAWGRIEPGQLESDPALHGLGLVRWLLLPAARGALSQAVLLVSVLALNNFAVPSILQVKVFPAEIWVRFNTTWDYWAALKLSWLLMLAPFLLIIWFSRHEVPWPRWEGRAPAWLFRRQLGSACFRGSGGVALIAILLSVVLPLAQLIGSAATWHKLPVVLAAGKPAFLNSIGLASITAILGVALGLIGWRWRFGWVFWVPFLLPGVLLGIALIYLFNRPWLDVFYTSTGIVILAWTIRYLAVSWTVTGQARRAVDSDLTDAARLDGAAGWRLFWHVHWPQMSPLLAAGGYVTYLLCLWDVETLVLIVPPGKETLALRVFNLLHYGHNPEVDALCLWLLVLAVLPLLIWAISRRVRSALAGKGDRA